jgi:transposase-like protein
MAAEISVIALATKVQTEGDAYRYMEQLRWGDTPTCAHCGSDRCHYLNPENGTSRKTRTGNPSERRVWFCGNCRKQFSVTTNTVFHGSKISLRKWLFVTYEMCANKNGIAAREIQRKYEVTAKTAWFMTQRLREAMKRGPFTEVMRGTIISDETWVGGKPGNNKQQGKRKGDYVRTHGKGPYTKTNKTVVLSLMDTATGEVRSKVVPNIKGDTLKKAIAEQVDIAGSVLHTDAGGQYRALGHEFAEHQYVDHSDAEYVRYTSDGGFVSTNAVEGFFSQLKRSIDGTHHHVSPKHLDRYLAEFDFRYTTRDLSDSARTQRLFGQVGGRRLTYRPLTGR